MAPGIPPPLVSDKLDMFGDVGGSLFCVYRDVVPFVFVVAFVDLSFRRPDSTIRS